MKAVLHCAIVVALLMCTSGCSMLVTLLGRPKAETIRPRISAMDLEGVGLTFDVEVRNRCWFPLRAAFARYGLDIEGQEFARSEAPLDVALPARGVGTVALSVRLAYDNLRRAYQSLRSAREVPYTLRGSLAFSVLGQTVELPLSYSDKFPVMRSPKFSDVSVRITEASLARARIVVEATVTNPNTFEMDIRGLGYILRLGDVQLGGLTASTDGKIPPGKTGRVSLTGELSAAQAALQVVRDGRIGKPSLTPTGSIATRFGTIILDPCKEGPP